MVKNFGSHFPCTHKSSQAVHSSTNKILIYFFRNAKENAKEVATRVLTMNLDIDYVRMKVGEYPSHNNFAFHTVMCFMAPNYANYGGN